MSRTFPQAGEAGACISIDYPICQHSTSAASPFQQPTIDYRAFRRSSDLAERPKYPVRPVTGQVLPSSGRTVPAISDSTECYEDAVTDHPGHGVAQSRPIRTRNSANSPRGTATSAICKVIAQA